MVRPQRRVVIMEPSKTGHRLFYVALLAAEAVEQNSQVTVVLERGVPASLEFDLHLRGLRGLIDVVEADDFSLGAAAELSRTYSSDVFVIPNGDSYVQALAFKPWTGHGVVSALVMREHSQSLKTLRRVVENAVKFCTFLVASRRRKVNVAVLKSSGWSGRSAFATVLDPVRLRLDEISTPDVLARFGMMEPLYTFAVVGALTERKNIPLVINGFVAADVPDSRLVVAGELETAIAERVLALADAAGPHVRIFDQLLSDNELDTIIASADCVVLAHSNNGPSGIFAKAAAAGVHVLGAGAVSLRADLRRLGRDQFWSPLDADSIARAMKFIASQEAPIPTATVSEASTFAQVILR